MRWGICNDSATIQRAIADALQKCTAAELLVHLREPFERLCEAGFKMLVAKYDFRKSEFKHLGRVVAAEGVNADLKAVEKLRDWDLPRNKTKF